MHLARLSTPASGCLALLLLAPVVRGLQGAGIDLRSHAAAGCATAVDADLILELGQAGSAGSLYLERRSAIRDRLEPDGALVRSVDTATLRAEMPGVERRPLFVGRSLLAGRTVRFPAKRLEGGRACAPEGRAAFADEEDASYEEKVALASLRASTGLADLVPGRSVELGETYPIAPSVLADVLALGGAHVYEDGPRDGSFPFRVGAARGTPLRARLEGLREVGDEHIATIRITGSLSVEVAFPGPGPLWRIGLGADERVPRRARLALEWKGRLEWWVEAGRADSLELEAEYTIAEELTRIATVCEDSGLRAPEREIPFDPDVHLLRSREPASAPQEGTLRLRLEVDC